MPWKLQQEASQAIHVKGIAVSGTTGTEGYLYLEKINVSPNKAPTATFEFEVRGANAMSLEKCC